SPEGESPVSLPALGGSGDDQGVPPRNPKKTILFIWGKSRVLPVRITSMTINETMHNPDLAPTRIEVTVNVEVLTDIDANKNDVAAAALTFNGIKRKIL